MATSKQIAANRKNAQLSTGPRTAQGKAVSRWNAFKTGIDATCECIPGEDRAALTGLAAEYDHQFRPLGLVERFLVDILVHDDWILRRYRFLTADLLNYTASVSYESGRGAECGGGFADNTESFRRLHRHMVDTKRSFLFHLAELERHQAARSQHSPEVDIPVTASPQIENPEIGFVSQPAPEPPPAPSPAPSLSPAPHPTPPPAEPPAVDPPAGAPPAQPLPPCAASTRPCKIESPS